MQAWLKGRPQGVRRRMTLSLSAAAVLLVLLGGEAKAATVTVGSPLTAGFGGQYSSSPSGTWVNSAIAEPGSSVASPVSGTIVRWRMLGNYSGGPFRLRVLRPDGTGKFTGAGTSQPFNPIPLMQKGALQTFDTSLPINAGDLIGLDVTTGTQIPVAGVTGSHVINWFPALPDGSSLAPPYNFDNVELGFNADVESTPPVTTQTKKKCKKKKHKRPAASAKKKKCKKKKKR
jgi:hypothetical protein